MDDARDMVGIYNISGSLICIHRFFPETFDAVDIMFCQDSNSLIVWESALKNSISVYQLIYDANSLSDIRLIEKIEPSCSPGLGLRSLLMTPSKQYLLGGYCDNKLRLISTLSWKESFVFDHASKFDTLDDSNSSQDLNIYLESETVEDGPLYEAVSKPF